MMEKIYDWVTEAITGDRQITEWFIGGFVVLCFAISAWIMLSANNTDSSVYIGLPEEQKKITEI